MRRGTLKKYQVYFEPTNLYIGKSFNIFKCDCVIHHKPNSCKKHPIGNKICAFFGQSFQNAPNLANWAHWVCNGNPPIDVPKMAKKHLKIFPWASPHTINQWVSPLVGLHLHVCTCRTSSVVKCDRYRDCNKKKYTIRKSYFLNLLQDKFNIIFSYYRSWDKG